MTKETPEREKMSRQKVLLIMERKIVRDDLANFSSTDQLSQQVCRSVNYIFLKIYFKEH